MRCTLHGQILERTTHREIQRRQNRRQKREEWTDWSQRGADWTSCSVTGFSPHQSSRSSEQRSLSIFVPRFRVSLRRSHLPPVTASCTAAVADPSFVSDHGAIVFLPGAMFMTSCGYGTVNYITNITLFLQKSITWRNSPHDSFVFVYVSQPGRRIGTWRRPVIWPCTLLRCR